MDEYVLRPNDQQNQMSDDQPFPASATFSESTQNQQQPQTVAQDDIYSGFTPSKPQSSEPDIYAGFTPSKPPIGSPEALNQAVKQSSQVGQQRFASQDQLVQQANFYLGKDSARKFQKFVAGNYEPLEDEDFTDKERQFLVDYDSKRARKIAASAVRYGGPIATGLLVPGGQGVAATTIAGIGSELLAQTLEPEKMRGYQILASGIPVPFVAKTGTGTGARRLLTSESGIAQQATQRGQLAREAVAGGVQSGLQAGVESLGEDVSGSEIALRTAIGSTLFPAISTAVRGVGAGVRTVSGKTSFSNLASTFAGEMQRPFAQRGLEIRAQEIAKELGNAAGIDPALSRQVADTFYNPALSGSTPEEVSDFRNSIQSMLEQSVITGRRSGLSGDDLTQAIVGELEKVSGKTGINPFTVEAVVRQADSLTEQATQKVDENLKKSDWFKDERNRRVLAFARRAEGRLQIESKDLQDEIVKLRNQRTQIGSEDLGNRTRIEGQIALLQEQQNKIEQGFDSRFAQGKEASAFETGLLVGAEGNKQVKKFEADQEVGYGKIRPDLQATTVEIDTGKIDKDGNPVLEIKSLEDLRKTRSQIYRLFDFNAPVQQGFFESWERLNKINDQITTAFDANPELRDALAAQNKSYSEGIKRFKGAYADRILRGIGEGGGSPEAVSSLLGARGGSALAALKDMSGETWETDVKPVLSDYIYNQIRGKNPVEFLNNLTEAKAARGKQLSKEVANEFFPAIGEIQEVASKYSSLINEEASLKSGLAELASKSKALETDVEKNITGANQLLKENQSAISKAKERLFAFQKSDKKRDLKGILGQPEKDTEYQQQLISLLADIKSNVKKGSGIDDDVLKQIASSPDASKMLRDLNDYALSQANKATDFDRVVSASIKGGELYGNIPSGNIVDFLQSSGGGVSTIKRAEEFTKLLRSNRPDLLVDSQNIVLGRIVKESLIDGKKSIDTNKMKALIAGGEKPGEYNALVNQLFGPGGVEKINTIADQLTSASQDKSSLVSKSIIPAIALGSTYLITGNVAAGAGAGLAGFVGRQVLSRAIGDSGESALGRLLRSPNYVKTITTPMDQLSKEQIALFDRNWSKMLKLETDRTMMQMEENQAEEKQLKEMRRKTGKEIY